MQLVFGNTLGFWAFLSIPALILCYMLQRKGKKQIISTLFLLEAHTPPEHKGSLLRRLQRTRSFWLQLLGCILLSILLLQPTLISTARIQHTVIVIDSSYSMAAFSGELLQGVKALTERDQQHAESVRWTILDTNLDNEILYNGDDQHTLLKQITEWSPSRGTHSISDALLLASGLVKEYGKVVFVGDTPQALPPGIEHLYIGQPIANVGFTGIEIGKDGQWKAIVKNYSSQTQTRKWSIHLNQQNSTARSIKLAPKGIETIQGIIPQGQDEYAIALENDQFPYDDLIPLTFPTPKSLDIFLQKNLPQEEQLVKLLNRIDDLVDAGKPQDAQIHLGTLSVDNNSSNPLTGIFWTAKPPVVQQTSRKLNSQITPSSHHITRDLSWNTLRVVRSGQLTPSKQAEILLYQEQHPLIWLEETAYGSQLIQDFSLPRSNAMKNPSYIILFRRMIEHLRQQSDGYEQRNFEAGEVFPSRYDLNTQVSAKNALNGREQIISWPQHFSGTPSWITIADNTGVISRYASHFAEVREADFSHAASETSILSKPQIAKQDIQDTTNKALEFPLLLAALLALLTSWSEKQYCGLWRKSA